MAQGYQVKHSHAKALPDLPGMLFRALSTVARKGLVSDELNALTTQYTAPAIDTEHLAAYKKQLPGFISDVPLTYYYLLAQRAHLALMLDDRFPWPILGMVHVANHMEYFAKVDISLPFTIDVQIEFPPRAATRKRVRPMYLVDFYQNDTLIVRCNSAYQVGGGSKSAERRSQQAAKLELSGWLESSAWSLPSDLGRSYAKLSGDYNPIHLHRWLSRWFGFARPIIHGMYSVARAQASLETTLQQEIQMLDVGFRRPVVLPTELKCLYQPDETRVMVADARCKRSFLEGTFATFVNETTKGN